MLSPEFSHFTLLARMWISVLGGTYERQASDDQLIQFVRTHQQNTR